MTEQRNAISSLTGNRKKRKGQSYYVLTGVAAKNTPVCLKLSRAQRC